MTALLKSKITRLDISCNNVNNQLHNAISQIFKKTNPTERQKAYDQLKAQYLDIQVYATSNPTSTSKVKPDNDLVSIVQDQSKMKNLSLDKLEHIVKVAIDASKRECADGTRASFLLQELSENKDLLAKLPQETLTRFAEAVIDVSKTKLPDGTRNSFPLDEVSENKDLLKKLPQETLENFVDATIGVSKTKLTDGARDALSLNKVSENKFLLSKLSSAVLKRVVDASIDLASEAKQHEPLENICKEPHILQRLSLRQLKDLYRLHRNDDKFLKKEKQNRSELDAGVENVASATLISRLAKSTAEMLGQSALGGFGWHVITTGTVAGGWSAATASAANTAVYTAPVFAAANVGGRALRGVTNLMRDPYIRKINNKEYNLNDCTSLTAACQEKAVASSEYAEEVVDHAIQFANEKWGVPPVRATEPLGALCENTELADIKERNEDVVNMSTDISGLFKKDFPLTQDIMALDMLCKNERINELPKHEKIVSAAIYLAKLSGITNWSWTKSHMKPFNSLCENLSLNKIPSPLINQLKEAAKEINPPKSIQSTISNALEFAKLREDHEESKAAIVNIETNPAWNNVVGEENVDIKFSKNLGTVTQNIAAKGAAGKVEQFATSYRDALMTLYNTAPLTLGGTVNFSAGKKAEVLKQFGSALETASSALGAIDDATGGLLGLGTSFLGSKLAEMEEDASNQLISGISALGNIRMDDKVPLERRTETQRRMVAMSVINLHVMQITKHLTSDSDRVKKITDVRSMAQDYHKKAVEAFQGIADDKDHINDGKPTAGSKPHNEISQILHNDRNDHPDIEPIKVTSAIADAASRMTAAALTSNLPNFLSSLRPNHTHSNDEAARLSLAYNTLFKSEIGTLSGELPDVPKSPRSVQKIKVEIANDVIRRGGTRGTSNPIANVGL